jgi:aminomethyltransferase
LISYGADTDEMSNPFELGMDRLIDLDQPQDFVGKAALSDIKARGATRRFMGLIIDGEKFTSTNESRWPVEWNGANAGYVSASAYSPRLDANIAMAMVSVAAIASGDKVHVLNETGRLTAKIVTLPMI